MQARNPWPGGAHFRGYAGGDRAAPSAPEASRGAAKEKCMMPPAALRRGLAELGQPLAEPVQHKLIAYLELLTKWNKTYNLTAIRDPLQMISQHLLHSLALRPHLPAGTLADVGSGGGLPGIPLAIAEPARRGTLNDANHKKAAFLQQAVIELQLANADVHIGRVQALRPASPFACVISRGFAELAQFVSSCP